VSRSVRLSPPRFTPLDAVEVACRRNLEHRTHHIRVITPMFGGGPLPGEPDPVTAIRGPTIRGHLRFWWRATVGARCASDPRALRDLEAEVWGSTDTGEVIGLSLDEVDRGLVTPCGRHESVRTHRGGWRWEFVGNDAFHGRNNALRYVVFPFEGKPSNEPGDGVRPKYDLEHPEPADCVSGTTFRLAVTYPRCHELDLTSHIEAALWAWTNFGGIGARTRRGCGALYCPDFAPTTAEVENDDAWCRQYEASVRTRTVPDVPTVAGGVALQRGGIVDRPERAWKAAVEVIQRFRQGLGVGRDGVRQRPGRSYWPEPESVRELTGARSRRHAPQGHMLVEAFPRALFGLPIIFHFAPNQGNPGGTELARPVDQAERMASPIITRPLMVKGGKSVPMIVRLSAPGPGALILRETQPPRRSWSVSRDPSSCPPDPRDANSPMKGRSAHGCALEAFLRFADERGFEEVW